MTIEGSPGNRPLPDGLAINIDEDSLRVLEDTRWQTEGSIFRTTNTIWLKAQMRGRQAGILVAELNVELDGEYPPTVLERSAYIRDLRVDDHNYRKQGIGSSLLNELDTRASRFGASRIEGKIILFDLLRTPYLPQFYRNRGYQLTESGTEYTMVKLLT